MFCAARGARSLRANVLARFVFGGGCSILLLSQAICPAVALLAKVAPTPTMLAAMDESGECTPCKAGMDECVRRLVEWLDAQIRGDDTVPFPADCTAEVHA
jgi:hypothetical protein